MKTLEEQTLHVCGCCKRPLPTDVFYISRATGLSGQLLQGMPQVRQPQQSAKGEMLPDMR